MADVYLVSHDSGQTWNAITFKALGDSVRGVDSTLRRIWQGETVDTNIGLVKCTLEPKQRNEESNP